MHVGTFIAGVWLLGTRSAGYRTGQLWVYGGTVLITVGLIGAGVALMLQKPRPATPPSPAAEKLAKWLGAGLVVLGLAVPAYAYFML